MSRPGRSGSRGVAVPGALARSIGASAGHMPNQCSGYTFGAAWPGAGWPPRWLGRRGVAGPAGGAVDGFLLAYDGFDPRPKGCARRSPPPATVICARVGRRNGKRPTACTIRARTRTEATTARPPSWAAFRYSTRTWPTCRTGWSSRFVSKARMPSGWPISSCCLTATNTTSGTSPSGGTSASVTERAGRPRWTAAGSSAWPTRTMPGSSGPWSRRTGPATSRSSRRSTPG